MYTLHLPSLFMTQVHHLPPLCINLKPWIYPLYRYKREFGFTIPSRDIIVDDIRVRGTASACAHNPKLLSEVAGEPRIEMVRAGRCSLNISTRWV
jgi:hypothetical protein